MNYLFKLLIVYYFILSWFSPSLSNFFYSVPILLFFFALILSSFFHGAFKFYKKYKTFYILSLLFGCAALLINLFHYDISYACIMFILAILPLLLFSQNIRVSSLEVNSLFLIAIMLSIFGFYMGWSNYGFLPGQEIGNTFDSLSRVSLFPSISGSYEFSYFVFLYNFFQKKRNYIILFLSAYYVVFGASRLYIFLLCMVLLFSFMVPTRKKTALYIVPAIAIIISVMPQILLYIANTFQFLKALLLRDVNNGTYHVSTRYFLMIAQVAIFFKKPFLGVGRSAALKDLNAFTLLEDASGSETFFTKILAEMGVSVFLYLFAFFSLGHKNNKNNDLKYFLIISIISSMFVYGSSIAPYNLNFLLFLLFIAQPEEKGFKI